MEARGNYQVCVSNHLEPLAALLQERALQVAPFARKVVLVPSSKVKTFLQFELAKSGIAAGVHFYTLPQFFFFLLEFEGSDKRLPTLPVLSFAIEYELLLILEEEDSRFQPVVDYVSTQKSAEAKRLHQVSKRLGALFGDYGLYGGLFLEGWLKQDGWQQVLWHKLFGQRFATPIEVCSEMRALPFPLHLFGFSFLPPLYQRFFKEMGATFYCLSPSPLFWGDLCTPKERAFVQKSGEERGCSASERAAFDRIVKDQNPLLASNGRLWRGLFSLLDETSLDECYDPSSFESPTRLHSIQHSLFELNHREEFPVDATVQIHAASSRRREVDVLLDHCLKWIRAGIEPKEILVVAPEIDSFSPFIETLFHAAGLDVAIVDGHRATQNSGVAALLHFLALKEGRFEREDVLKLFSFASFRTKLGFTEAQAERVCTWLRKASILWGFDAQHREEILRETVSPGTWEFGFDRLLCGLAMEGGEDAELPVDPLSCVDLFEAELLGKAIDVITSMRKAFKAVDMTCKRMWKEWLASLTSWVEAFLAPTSDEQEGLMRALQQLRVMEGQSAPVYSFALFALSAKEALESRSSGASHYNRQEIRCCSLKTGTLVPAKAIFALGMDEEAFPRRVKNNPFCDPAFQKEADFHPRGVDEDRALFLSLFLFAKDQLAFSYQNRSDDDGKEQGMSLLLEEFKTMLGESGQGLVVAHPVRDYDPSYFRPESSCTSESHSRFLTAEASLGKERSEPAPFFISNRQLSPSNDLVIPLKDLRKLARHPIQFYVNKGLGIFLRKPEDKQAEFVLSPLHKWLLRKQSLDSPLDRLLVRAKANGTMPLWGFSAVAESSVIDEVETYHQNLCELGVDLKRRFSVILDRGAQASEWVSKSHVRVPALKVDLEDGRIAWITGDLNDVTESGLLFHGKEGVEDRTRARPEFLVLSALELKELKSKELLFTKKAARGAPLEGDVQTMLQRYVNYYEHALHYMSPMMPKWAQSLLEGSEEAFAKKVSAVKNQSDAVYVDPYLNWAFAKGIDLAALFEQWASLAGEALG